MQTKLTEHVTEPYNGSNNFKNTIIINNETNLYENDIETQNENSNFNTPKSKRIRMTITLEKQLSNRTKFNAIPDLFTQKYSPFLSMSLPNKTPETFKYQQSKQDESNLNTSRLLDTIITDEFDLIDLTISPENKEKSEKSPINTMETSSVALKELDSNDESLNRKKSLRKLESNETKLKEIIKEQQPKKIKRQQSASSVTTSLSSSTKTNMKTTQNQMKPLNTFACLRNLGSTCYINCIVQVMRYTPGFVSSIHRLTKQIDYLESVNSEIETEINSNNNVKFVKNLHQLLEEMSEKEKQDRRPIYSPAKFVKTVWTLLSFWSNGSQQDAHEFLQYTIHFINECDLFLRKIHQQYQIKLPFNDEPIKKLNDTNSESILTNISTKTTTRKTKNSQKTADPLENILDKEQTLDETKQIKIDRRRKEFRNIQQLEKENFSNQNEQSTTGNSLQIVMNQKLSDRLIKSIPKLNETTNDILKNNLETNNFLRTPTKGGASAYNFTIDESTLPVQVETIKPDLNKSKSPNLIKKTQQKFKTDNSEFNFDLKNELIDDKDLVSKRLKETINSTSITIKKKRPINYINRKSEPVTKFKRETIINSNLNDSINSIIIIDSDLDDDLDDYQYRIDTDEDELEEININKAKLSERIDGNVFEEKDVVKIDKSNSCFKQLTVAVEKFNLEKLLNKNGLRLSKESLSYVKDDVKTDKTEQKIKPNQKTNPSDLIITTRTRNNVKKFGAKAKTFPADLMLPQNDESFKHIDLDEITTVNLVKPINEINKISKNFKSKLRSTSTGTISEEIPQNQSPFLLASNLMKTFSQSTITDSIQTSKIDSNFSKLPPSPAELLRKYSTSNGYTCEMDKLFKGSSVTVTQCLECENLRKCPEAFYDRSIPLDTNDDLNDDNSTNWISKCLSNESYLNDNSKYMCDKCSSKQEAKIHTQYTQMPNILILHLLSYGITSSIDGNMNAQKLSNRSRLVSYFDYVCAREQTSSLNNHFNLSNIDGYNSPISTRNLKRQRNRNSEEQNKNLKHQFKLFAVVMHSGTTLNSGHYTAYVNYKIISQSISLTNNLSSLKSEKNCPCFINNTKLIQTSNQNDSNLISNKNTDNESEWLHFDDTKVKSLSNIEFHRKIIDSNYDSPYILFYVKE